LTAVLRQARKLAGLPSDGRPTDAELLERFSRARDAAAFEMLVARHGPLVWRVCRRVLGHDHDAEDAWQATFLVLARGAGAVRNPGALAGWLHGVAFRLAEKARAASARRRAREQTAVHGQTAEPCQEAAWRELGRIIEEAVHALPERYKAPVLLCYWQGRTNEEAARQLGWATGTLKARLAKARQLLHARLTARGVTLPAGAVALLLSPAGEAAEAVPPALAAATASAGRGGVEASGISAGAAALAGEALKRAGLGRLKLVMAFLLVLGAAGLGAGSLSQTPPDEPPAQPRQAAGDAERAKGLDAGEAGPRKDLYGDPLPPGAVARLGTVRLRHIGHIHAAVFAPGGKAVATVGRDGFVRVWDLSTGKEVSSFCPPQSSVRAFTYTADGQAVTLATSDEGLRLWDATTGRAIGKLFGAGQERSFVEISWDGKVAVTAAYNDTTAQVWDTATGKELRRVTTGHTVRLRALRLSQDGRLLASLGWKDDSVRLHDTRTGALRHVFAGEEAPAGTLAFSADGQWIAGVRRNRSVLLWDAVTGKLARRLEPPPRERIESVAFAADSKTLISGGEQVRFWDVATGKPVRQLTPPRRSGWYVAPAPDGQTLATWGECELLLWELKTGRRRLLGRGHQGPVNDLAVSPDGRLVATTCFGDVARLWDAATGRELRQFPGSEEGTARHLLA
jgi:RNA polymerase sigma factor (sigma-70 family)